MGSIKQVRGGVVTIYGAEGGELRAPPLTQGSVGDQTGSAELSGSKNPLSNLSPFSWLLRDGAANAPLCLAVRTIERAVLEVVNAWAVESDEHRQGHFQSLGDDLLRGVAKNLGIWFEIARDLGPKNGGNLRVPNLGMVVFTDKKRGMTEVAWDDLRPVTSQRRHNGITQIIGPHSDGKDALKALGRLTHQLSPDTANDGKHLAFHPRAAQACDDFRQAVLSAIKAISEHS